MSRKQKDKCLICFNKEKFKEGNGQLYTSEINTAIWKLGILVKPFFNEMVEKGIVIDNKESCDCGMEFIYLKTFLLEYVLNYIYYCRYMEDHDTLRELDKCINHLSFEFNKFYEDYKDRCTIAIFIYALKNILYILKNEKDNVYIDFNLSHRYHSKIKNYGEYKKSFKVNNKLNTFDPEGRFKYLKDTKRKYNIIKFGDFLTSNIRKEDHLDDLNRFHSKRRLKQLIEQMTCSSCFDSNKKIVKMELEMVELIGKHDKEIIRLREENSKLKSENNEEITNLYKELKRLHHANSKLQSENNYLGNRNLLLPSFVNLKPPPPGFGFESQSSYMKQGNPPGNNW
jgi:hypothetical protein